MKYAENYLDIANEIKAIKRVNSNEKAMVPKLLEYGMLVMHNYKEGQNKIAGFYIMPKYEMSLLDHLEKHKFAPSEIFRMTLSLIDIFESIHDSGYVYNDLKPQNIMVTKEGQFVLIDLGMVKKIITKGKHIEDGTVSKFQGNLLFSSLRAMMLKTTSRRDDIS